MLTMRSEQMGVLSHDVRRRFELQMHGHLRQHFASQTEHMTDGELLAHITSGITKAEMYGIKSQFDVMRFLEYTVMYGTDFDSRSPWARKILNSPDISGTKKMDRIDTHDEFCGNR